MISKNTLDFLKKIKKNNNKQWFEEHKDEYKALHAEFKTTIEDIAEGIATFDPRVKHALNDKKTIKIFRIYRDARFSKDKSPYKTNFGGTIAPHGFESGNPGYYVHIEPGNCFIGGGLHMPESALLKNVRDAIVHDDKPFRLILKKTAFKNTYGSLSGYDMLKTVPRGYDKDHPASDLLRFKSFLGTKNFSDKDVLAQGFDKQVLKDFKALEPLVAYLARVR